MISRNWEALHPPIHTSQQNLEELKSRLEKIIPSTEDPVNHPKHYTEHPSGVECIEITEHMGFNLGNAVKYIWRCDLKKDVIEDLRKAIWYIQREISLREECATTSKAPIKTNTVEKY
jgi:hypothetical protein